MAPSAPGLFSTTMGCPRDCDMAAASNRANRSVELPGDTAARSSEWDVPDMPRTHAWRSSLQSQRANAAHGTVSSLQDSLLFDLADGIVVQPGAKRRLRVGHCHLTRWRGRVVR